MTIYKIVCYVLKKKTDNTIIYVNDLVKNKKKPTI